jgi:predicted O-linked N-acetylglucosamine transferase (SPINDLY family)
MGVPVLTCPGTTFAARVAASLLGAAGRSDLIAATPEDYEAAAIAHAADRSRLEAIRQDLEQTVRSRPIFDTRRFARDLEMAFSRMQARRMANQAPADIDLAS